MVCFFDYKIKRAKLGDAESLAHIIVESWRSAYFNLIPKGETVVPLGWHLPMQITTRDYRTAVLFIQCIYLKNIGVLDWLMN